MATSTQIGSRPSPLRGSAAGQLPDKVLRWVLTGLAGLILALLIFFFVRLIVESSSAISHNGIGFLFIANWNPPISVYHAAALMVGSLITSAIALLIGVPVAVATALYITELCPRRLRGPLSFLVDLLAAVPSVVYGLWGVFFLGPKLVPVMKWFANTFSFIPWIGGGGDTITSTNYFIAGLVLAIMILPIVSALSREVLVTVPPELKEGALALGATRWEMIRMSVLPHARPGITGGAMLGLGRAIGETVAVLYVVGGSTSGIGHHLFAQGATFASVIAAEFGEAQSVHLHASSLFEAGLVLFLMTLIVNMIARWFITRGTRGRRDAESMAMAATDTALAQGGLI